MLSYWTKPIKILMWNVLEVVVFSIIFRKIAFICSHHIIGWKSFLSSIWGLCAALWDQELSRFCGVFKWLGISWDVELSSALGRSQGGARCVPDSARQRPFLIWPDHAVTSVWVVPSLSKPDHRYMVEIFPIQRKTLYDQSTNQLIWTGCPEIIKYQVDSCWLLYYGGCSKLLYLVVIWLL